MGAWTTVSDVPVAPDTPDSDHPDSVGRWSSLNFRLALLLVVVLVISLAVTTVFAVVSISTVTSNDAKRAASSTQEYAAEVISRAEVNVSTYEATQLVARKALSKDITLAEINGVDRFRQEAQAGLLTVPQAQAAALAMLKSLNYGPNNDYMFTYDRDMNVLEHQNPNYQSGNFLNKQLVPGVYVFRQIRDLAVSGGGYITYQFPKPNDPKQTLQTKTSYVTFYAPWQWVIGTGVYTADIQAAASKQLMTARTDLGTTFARVNQGGSDRSFVLGPKGNTVVTQTGAHLDAIDSTAWGHRLSAEIEAAAPATKGKIVTRTLEAPLRNGKDEPWLFEISRYSGSLIDTSTGKPLNWILVSAIPVADITRPGYLLGLRQVLLGLLVLLVGLAIGLAVSRRIVGPVRSMTKAALDLEQDRFQPADLDAAAARRDEVGTLARAFQRMGSQVVQREQRLRQEVERLEVVIDRDKVDRDVGEIAESDFFMDLQARAAAMRARNKAADAAMNDGSGI